MTEPVTLPDLVEQSIARRKLLPRGASVLVAVSGGLDSMVLLHLLASMASKHRWRLTVAHFNHQLRGRSSDADERLVQRTAKKLRLPFVCGRGDVREVARKEKLSLEMAGRALRHAFFALEASRRKIERIALAHHADDQVELFFLRLFRGAGGEGLAGMKWQNPSQANPKIKLVRPLLEQSKSSLAAYAERMRVPFREDATNAQIEIQRNRIRHQVIPFLRKHQPALERVILRQMEVIGAEAEFVTQAAKDWLAGKHSPAFEKLSVAVQRRCLQLQLTQLSIPIEFNLIERLRLFPNQRTAIFPARVSDTQHATRNTQTVHRDATGLLHVHETGKPDFADDRHEAHLAGRAGEATLGKVRIRWKKLAMPTGTFRAPLRIANCEIFDASKIGSDIVLRYWQPGDRFQPIGMEKTAKLQDLFMNQKIPRQQRHELLVATTEKGEIFWVEGLRIGDQFKLDKGTVYGLKWTWNRLK